MIANLLRKIPWWMSICMALASFLLLNWLAENVASTGGLPSGISGYIRSSLLQTFAVYTQFAIPSVFLSSAVASLFLNQKKATIYDRIAMKCSPDSLNKISWRNFEHLVAEYFERLNFTVEANKGGRKTGVNFTAKKGDEEYLIQCRQSKSSQIGIDDIRRLLEVVSTVGATGGIVVTSGEFAKEVLIFAKAHKIMLLDGNELHANLNSHKIFDSLPERNLMRRLKVLAWWCAGFLAFFMGGSVFYHYKTGTPIVWLQQTEKMLAKTEERLGVKIGPSPYPTTKASVKDQKFTEDQIKKASKTVLHKRVQEQFIKIETNQNDEKAKKYYELELATGGRIFTDNIMEKNGKISYKNNRGLIVSLDRNEVKSMKKIEVKK